MQTPGEPAATAGRLLATVAAEPSGTVAPSLYDTGRLIAIAPWLAGHDARIEFLCRRHGPDGGWGWPDGYAFVPTLSATGGLLAELARRAGRIVPSQRRPGRVPTERVQRAAHAGLAALRRWLAPQARLAIPDTIGVELVVPALLAELAELTGAEWLRPPAGFDARLLTQLRARLSAGTLPRKGWACLEVFGPAAAGAPGIRPTGGNVGCSAAATAAWLSHQVGRLPATQGGSAPPEPGPGQGGPDGSREAVRFLDTLQARAGGPVPGVSPITYFEAAWVLNSLSVAGPRVKVPAAILDRLVDGLGPEGVPAAPGLPADADDTAAVLAALLRHGRVRRPDPLLDHRVDGYFTCFHDERSPSVSTNAHVLEALALYLARRPVDYGRFGGPAAMAARWLLDRQRSDGSWQDKWHASPYYATACCVLALSLYGGARAGEAVARAAAWVRDSRRPDGSWGRWRGTVEETAYAVQILARAPDHPGTAAAIEAGRAVLARPGPEHPPLWHAKDLYTPVLVVEAARLAARQIVHSGHRRSVLR